VTPNGRHIVVDRDRVAWRWTYVDPAGTADEELRLPSSVGFVNWQEAAADARIAYPGVPLHIEDDERARRPVRAEPASPQRSRLLRLLAAVVLVLAAIWLLRAVLRK
jgi:hypothetical protein